MTDRDDWAVEDRLSRAFASEVELARADLATRPLGRRRRPSWSRSALVALVAVVAGVLAMQAVAWIPKAAPTGSAGDEPSTSASPGRSPTPASPTPEPSSPAPAASDLPQAVGSIPAELFGRTVLRPSDVGFPGASLGAGETVLIGGTLTRSLTDCGPPCPPLYRLERDGHSNIVDVPAGLTPAAGRLVIEVYVGTATMTATRVVWRDDASLPPGTPATIDGVRVLTVSQGLFEAERSFDASSFLVAGWLRDPAYRCPATMPGDTSLLGLCSHLPLDESEITPPRSAEVAKLGLVFLGSTVERPTKGPAVFRVHTHDPLASQCQAAQRAECDRQSVVDEVVWSMEVPPTVTEEFSGFTIERPREWSRWQANARDPMVGGAFAYLGTDLLRTDCAMPVDEPPNPGPACRWPLGRLSENGILVTVFYERLLRPLPATGEAPIAMNGQMARLEIERPGRCAEIHGDVRLHVQVPMNQPTPLSNLFIEACIRGPDLADLEAHVRAMLSSATLTSSIAPPEQAPPTEPVRSPTCPPLDLTRSEEGTPAPMDAPTADCHVVESTPGATPAAPRHPARFP